MKTHSYPAWFYGPNGQSQVFNSDVEVPAGWQDHPSKVADKIVTPAKTGSAPVGGAATAAGTASAAQTGASAVAPGDQSNTLDAEGWPFDPALHAATQSRTKAGLWRMKVGVSRPDPKEGFPKPVLDL